MIINELAYKVTIKADEFLNGKRKVKQEAQDLKNEIEIFICDRKVNNLLNVQNG